MIYYNDKLADPIYYNDQVVALVYCNGRLVYTAIHSCFGKGYWINDKPWSNTDAYKN